MESKQNKMNLCKTNSSYTINSKEVDSFKRSLNHNKERLKQLKDKYDGNEQKYTFWAGRDVGYYEGKIAMLEDLLISLNALNEE